VICAEYSYCFAALNVGLQAAENPLCVLGCLKDGGADREDKGRYNRAAGSSAQHNGQFRRVSRYVASGVLRLLGYQFELIRHSA